MSSTGDQPVCRVSTAVKAVSGFIHHYFLVWLVGCYALAGLAPALGLVIRHFTIAEVTVQGQTVRISLPMVMLALLLFNGGLGVKAAAMKGLVRRPRVLLAGLAGNLVLPVVFIGALGVAMRVWRDPDEVQSVLVGLVMIAAVPVAGSSTAWSQNANGNMALAIGLVLFSTLLSPLISPLAFEFGQHVTTGEYSQAMDALEGFGTGFFLFLCVLLPSVLGMVTRRGLPDANFEPVQPVVKLINAVNLLVLNYSNASVSLPKIFARPDWDFLLVVFVAVLGMCVSAFATGSLLSRWLRADQAQRTSLMFGLGMSNNGTGLVLASATFGNHPRVLLPIIFYNLVQHLVAGFVDAFLARPGSADSTPLIQKEGIDTRATESRKPANAA